MAFTAIVTPLPQSIADISITITDYLDETETSDSAGYEVQIVYDNGVILVKTGDLVPHLTGAQIAALQTLMADLRMLAQDLIP